MQAVESLPHDASGALLIGAAAAPDGLLLVERNRVCWVAAMGMGQRLSVILRNRCNLPLDDAELEALYARCRHDQRPLGEALVTEGLIEPEQLRAAMKQHTVESLIALDSKANVVEDIADWPLTWVEHSQRGYNPRYTFAASEVVAAVGAHLIDETLSELLDDHLQALTTSSGGVTIGFADRELDLPVFVDGRAASWLSVQDMLDVGEWTTAALDASPGFSPIVAHAWARAADGGAVAWRYDGQRCAAICPDNASLQRLVSTLDNQSLAMVLATKLSVLERVRERAALASQDH